jgi:two-component system cell cycle sensor histidine kinase/response regulator CckA
VTDKNPTEAPAQGISLHAQKLEALGQLAGGIAHDFNNILSIIEGHTELALKQLQTGNLTPEQLERIRAATARGAGLTRQLLAFGRQKIGVLERLDAVKALAGIRLLIDPLFGAAVRADFSLPAVPLWVQAGEDHLAQIVLNLALNARDALPAGGDVMISCMACGEGALPPPLRQRPDRRSYLRLSVTDNGVGISPNVLPHIFEPFYSTKERGRGTGMGLAVVYGIVEQLGGLIDVKSRLGEGTAVHVYLPLAAAEPVQQTLSDSWRREAGSLRGRTVLLAEDEPELRDILGLMLEGFEMKVIRASNGNEAFNLQRQFAGEIDFLLTDVVMPEMDGIALAEIFAARRPDTNVVYMSGYPFLNAEKGLRVPDTASFISKPIQEDTVRQVLERALERRALREAATKDAEADSDQ